MPTYVLMTKLSSELMKDEKGRRAGGEAWRKRVKKLCPNVKWKAHYALLGPYDFMDIYEASGDDVAFKVSLLSRAEGAETAESWPAMHYKELLPFFDELIESA